MIEHDPIHVLKERHGNYRDGRSVTADGYVLVEAPDHPQADSRGRVYEHVLVASRALGKPLSAGTIVHHIDDDRQRNVSNNLVICQDRAYHNLIHGRCKAYRATGNANAARCGLCGRWGLPNDPRFNLHIHASGKRQGVHRTCKKVYDRRRWLSRRRR